MLSEKNKHSFDIRIKFREKGHKYWIDNDDTDIVSCTSYIHSFFEDFDTYGIIKNILKSDKWKNDPEYRYYQKTETEIISLTGLNKKSTD